MVSVALNVSLIVRLVYESEEGHYFKASCLKKRREPDYRSGGTCLAISSSAAALANFSRPSVGDRVINLDQ